MSVFNLLALNSKLKCARKRYYSNKKIESNERKLFKQVKRILLSSSLDCLKQNQQYQSDMRQVQYQFLSFVIAVVCIGLSWVQLGYGQRPITASDDTSFTKPNRKVGDKVARWYNEGLPGRPIEHQSYYQFDVMLPDLKQANSLPTATYQSRLWPGAIVPYVFMDEFTELELFLFEHARWQFHTQTCIRFVPRTTEIYYVSLERKNTGCWSYTGRYTNNKWNKINLMPYCFSEGPGLVVHEMMHSVGFHHEFIRPDRDQYIWINKTATFDWPSVESNFATKSNAESEVYGTKFDYGSVMMYSRFATSAGYYPTMINLQPWDYRTDFGNRTGFSYSDLIRINYMYCNGTKWDPSVRKPFSLPVPVDDGESVAPERPQPPAVIPAEEATLGDLVY
ncbi:astacin-like [Sabethes cyaneus]|uniref:astacin-like n=1 Tax=Sabethes cyaneus TaxID=53552 RepID=UPI00237EDE72|nr:astacin-like [Sabethes cyaneus]